MEHKITVTLVANAGVLLRYRGSSLLLDGIYGAEGHDFSKIKPEVWADLLAGGEPFRKIDYLLFTHEHPDHFSPDMTRAYVEEQTVKGAFLPENDLCEGEDLASVLAEKHIPCVVLAEETEHAAHQIEPHITVRAIPTSHLDPRYSGVRHFCYLISFDEKNILFTADVDYVHETLSQLGEIPLRAVFVNPLFFHALHRRKFFQGMLDTKTICVYHIPFPEEDTLQMRPTLARDLADWSDEREAVALSEPFQQIGL